MSVIFHCCAGTDRKMLATFFAGKGHLISKLLKQPEIQHKSELQQFTKVILIQSQYSSRWCSGVPGLLFAEEKDTVKQCRQKQKCHALVQGSPRYRNSTDTVDNCEYPQQKLGYQQRCEKHNAPVQPFR